jgi:hypothetical protein
VIGLAILSGSWWRLGSRLPGVSSRWLITTGALWALPLLLAPPLASRDVYSYACQGEIWRSGLDPYAAGAADGGCLWSGAVPDLWQHTPAPYGPVGIALSGAAAAVARAVGGPADHQLLVAVTVLRIVALIGGVLIAAYAGRLASAVGVRPVAARWLALLSPLVAVHLVSGAHNDALTAGLIVAALAVAVPKAASRSHAGTVLNDGDPAQRGRDRLDDADEGDAANSAARAAPGIVEPAVTWPNSPDREIGEHSPHVSSAIPQEGTPPGFPAGTVADGMAAQTTETEPTTEGGTSDRVGRGVPWGAAVGAGAFLGLAVGVKVTAIIALPFVVLLVAGWRLRRETPAWVTITLAGVAVTGTASVVFAAATLATGLDLGWIGALSDTGSLVQWTSLPTGIGMAAGYLLRAAGAPGAVDTAVDVARICGIVALAVIGLALCLRALRSTLALRPDNRTPTPVTEPTEVRGETTQEPATRPQPDVIPAPAVRPRQDVLTAPGTPRRREVVAACGWALGAAAVLLPVFYPWYALVPLAVLACATPPGRTRNLLATAAIAITALTLPNGLGLPVLTKLPGAVLDVAIVAALAYRFRKRRSTHEDPVPADGPR